MARPKYNYKGKEFLKTIEDLAKKGMTDKEIAFAIGLNPNYFSGKKDSVREFSEALTRARSQINSVVRQKYLSIGLGGIKTKNILRRKVTNDDGDLVDGDVIQENEIELPPNPNVLFQWLFNHDEEWRQKIIEGKRLDVTSNGKDVGGVQLIFGTTPLSDKDIEDIKRLQNGISHEEDSADAGISEA